MAKKNSRRAVFAASVMIGALSATAGPVGAFEPPADPNDSFTCDGGPVMGHPGREGLSTAMVEASSTTAWMAVSENGPVTQC